MTELSKKEQRAMVERNFGVSIDFQKRAINIPSMVFKTALSVALRYCGGKHEATEHEKFHIRLCCLVFEAVELGCLRIMERAAHYPHLSLQEKTAIQLAGVYCEGRSKVNLPSGTIESSDAIKEALHAGKIMMEGQVLLYCETHYADNFIGAAGIFKKIFDKAKQENRIVLSIKEVMANR